MKVIRWAGRALSGLLDRLAAVAGALGLSQLPGFMQHYIQRLGGHAAEARHNVAGWQRIADTTTGGDLTALIARYQAGPAREVIEAGRKCAADLYRAEQLEQAFESLAGASAWQRPLAFVANLDRAIARSALAYYEPNVPFNIEGLVYVAVGLLLGWGLFRILCGCCRGAVRAGGRCLARRANQPSESPDDGDAPDS